MKKLPAKFKLVVPMGYEKAIQKKLFDLNIISPFGKEFFNPVSPFFIIEGKVFYSCDFCDFVEYEYEEIKFSDLMRIHPEENKDNSFMEILQKCQNRFHEDANYYSDEFIKDLAIEIQKEIDRRIEKAIRENKGE